MIGLFWLKLKSQRYLLILLIVVVTFQIVMGQASSYVLADREPPLGIAVQQMGDDPLSHELIENLSATPNLEIIKVDAALSQDEVFRQVRVQALLIVPADFKDSIEQKKQPVVMLIPAPGITNRDFAREQVAGVLMRLQARYDLVFALNKLGVTYTFEDGVPTTDLLDVVYEGPMLQSSSFDAKPVFGVAALLILLAYLHAALTVPTREDKRVLMRGRTAFVRQFCASLLVVWVVWLVVIALYFVFLAVFIGMVFDVLTCLGFIAIMFYVSLLAALLAQFIGKHVASWVFLPLFLLSMTIGGGLWAQVTISPLFSPLVPVAAVVVPGSATLLGSGILFGAGVLILVSLALMFKIAKSFSNIGNRA